MVLIMRCWDVDFLAKQENIVSWGYKPEYINNTDMQTHIYVGLQMNVYV